MLLLVEISRLGLWRTRLPLPLRLRYADRLPTITATSGHCDESSSQIVKCGSISNNPPFVIDAISYIQRIESSLREIFRKLIQFE
jgi:hypothetical protein